jgi:hypothetical protein
VTFKFEIHLNKKKNNIYLKLVESIVFKVRKCSPEYMQIRQQFHPNDRIIHNHLPMLIEVNQDGTNLSTPRVFKIHPNTTYVGRNVKTEIGSQYIYVNIDYEIIQKKQYIYILNLD